ncbi:uncharacterized protein BDZ99DRAFT_525849 [Mytilinidion resinicola]|uniref:RING-type domain-containing protein n=1 Tax=Mytilinidion resinicola TaxID=574789 RepID=A0A6A6Y8G0_9PEZI|nr:uncharacterized protein BDZ99DRAFT_525849 [Mytilinidion resinicola]KAF2804254.1 hypothetical protein BDZ99DRAFT_525849 [Mytilinidion resinicola]
MTTPQSDTCPICKNPFALTTTDRNLLATELVNNGYNTEKVNVELDVLVKPPCGHEMGLFCLQRWINLGHTTCPYCTLTMLNDTKEDALFEFVQPDHIGFYQGDDELMQAVDRVLKTYHKQERLPTWWDGVDQQRGEFFIQRHRRTRWRYRSVVLGVVLGMVLAGVAALFWDYGSRMAMVAVATTGLLLHIALIVM